MSSQSSTSIPFSILSPPESVRLLELSPELLAVIEDKATAKIRNLTEPVTEIYDTCFKGRIQLKSSPTDDSATSTKPKDQYLHLCTESHVWAVRQVSTSNSVYILSPSTLGPSAATNNDLAATGPGITAFAQPNSTLELLPAPFTPADIDAAIRRVLPTFTVRMLSGYGDDDDEKFGESSFTIAELTASLPYPHLPVAEAKRRNFVFTTAGLMAYIPSPELLLAAWRMFVQYANIRRFDLSTMDVLYLHEVTTHMAVDEGPVLPSVMNAVARVFVDDEAWLKERSGEYWEVERAVGSLEGKWKGKEVTSWVGELSVRCAEGQRMEQHLLIEKWQDLVPSQWWKWCKSEELEQGCKVEGGWVSWKGKGQSLPEAAELKEPAKAPAPASAATGKRNWHEMFAAQRKR